MKKRIMQVAFAMLLAISLPMVALADFDGENFEEEGGTAVPVDMGIGLAIAGGVGYAVKKRRDSRLANRAK